MLESRSSYGYYGAAGGYTGETPPPPQSKEDELWDWIVSEDIATEEELRLVTCINGYSVETLNDVIEVRTGYHSREQYIDCEYDNESEACGYIGDSDTWDEDVEDHYVDSVD